MGPIYGQVGPLTTSQGVAIDPAVQAWAAYNTAIYGGSPLPGELRALTKMLRMVADFRSQITYWLIPGGASTLTLTGATGKNWCTTPLLYTKNTGTNPFATANAGGSLQYAPATGLKMDPASGFNSSGLNVPGIFTDPGLTLNNTTVLYTGSWTTAADSDQIRPLNGGSTWMVKYFPAGFSLRFELRTFDVNNTQVSTPLPDTTLDAWSGTVIARLGVAGATLDRDELRMYRHPSLVATATTTATTAHTGHLTDALISNASIGQGAPTGGTFTYRHLATARTLTAAHVDRWRAAVDFIDRWYGRVS